MHYRRRISCLQNLTQSKSYAMHLKFITKNSRIKTSWFYTKIEVITLLKALKHFFLPRNFLHLTGLTYINPKNSSDFYRKCLSNNLSEDDFTFKEDGTTDLKLKALPQIVNFFQMSKMTTLYTNTQPRLYTERLAGNVTACVGFIVDDNNGYYVPNTCLLQDIRTLGAPTNQILAILSKPASKEYSLYSTIEYQAKGISVDSIRSLKAFRSLISL